MRLSLSTLSGCRVIFQNVFSLPDSLLHAQTSGPTIEKFWDEDLVYKSNSETAAQMYYLMLIIVVYIGLAWGIGQHVGVRASSVEAIKYSYRQQQNRLKLNRDRSCSYRRNLLSRPALTTVPEDAAI